MNPVKSRLRRLCLLCAGAVSLFNSVSWADGLSNPIPSFYQEPGISSNRSYVSQHPSELIDPFTGKLQLHTVDLFIPGNGGMDIKVQRSYTSPNDWPADRKLPRSADNLRVELSGMLRPGGSHEEVTVHGDRVD